MSIHLHVFNARITCLLLFVVFTFTHLSLRAQAPTKIWDKTLDGGPASAINRNIIPLSDGSFIVLGSSGYANLAQECYVTKIDATGAKLWEKNYGGTGFDTFKDAVVTSDGNILLFGYITGAVDEAALGSRGATDFWVIKVNVSTGNKMFERRLGSNDEEYAVNIVPSGDGNFIIGGTSFSEKNNEKKALNNGISDYWVLKITGTTGVTATWGTGTNDKSIGGSDAETLTQLIRTSSGEYILAGHSESGISGDKTSASKGLNDYWIVKLNASGDIVWNKSFGTSSDDKTVGIAQVTGGYVIGGYTTAGINGDKTSANRGTSTTNDFWLIKIDESGTKIWEKSYGTNGDDIATFIKSTSDGGFVLGGATATGINGDKTEAGRGLDDYWLLKLDSDGNKIWDKALGGSADDSPAALAETSTKDLVISGTSGSPISGDKTQVNDNDDFWLVKLNILPSFTASAIPATCGSTSANADGALHIATANAITKYGYSIGSVYTGPAFAAATAAGSTPFDLVTTLPNPTSTQPYIIRGYKDATTYIDRLVILTPTKCVVSDLSVTLSPVQTTGAKGEILSHTVTVSNAGPQPADNVMIRVTLPDTVSYQTSTAQQGIYQPATSVWTVGTVPVGTLTLTVNYKVN